MWYVLQLILRLIGFWLPDGWAISRILSRLDGEIELGFEFSRNVDATDSVARNLDPKTNDYVGLDVAGHCTFRSWRRSVELRRSLLPPHCCRLVGTDCGWTWMLLNY